MGYQDLNNAHLVRTRRMLVDEAALLSRQQRADETKMREIAAEMRALYIEMKARGLFVNGVLHVDNL